MSHTPQVALLVETARGYGRDVALGIARYARLHGPWSFHLTPGDFEQALPSAKYWKGEGVFARMTGEELADQLLASGLPTVALDMTEAMLQRGSPYAAFSDLRVDSAAAANLAAAHLLERRRAAYAFVGTPGKVWSDRREGAFCKAIRNGGFETHVYRAGRAPGKAFWDAELPKLAEWIGALPKPVGIMACNDEHGLYVLDACRRVGVRVPEEVAVVGVDNDTLLCELCSPTLSSVVLNGVEGGYRAAAHLAAMMKTGRNRPRRIQVEALRVELRQSSDVQGSDNVLLSTAMASIQQHYGRDMDADGLAQRLGVPRRELDRQFREAFGRSVAAQIQQVRLDQAKRLLEETDHPIPDVAEAAGYSSASYLIQVFRRELGTTPSKYRSGVRALAVTPIKALKNGS